MEWISVNDRLPEEGIMVIVEGGIGRLEKGKWFSYTACRGIEIQWIVKHWMPLPNLSVTKPGQVEVFSCAYQAHYTASE